MHPMMQKLREQVITDGLANRRDVPAYSFLTRFPKQSAEVAKLLAAAIDFEVHAGWAVRDGKLAEGKHLREQARAAWSAARRLGVQKV